MADVLIRSASGHAASEGDELIRPSSSSTSRNPQVTGTPGVTMTAAPKSPLKRGARALVADIGQAFHERKDALVSGVLHPSTYEQANPNAFLAKTLSNVASLPFSVPHGVGAALGRLEPGFGTPGEDPARQHVFGNLAEMLTPVPGVGAGRAALTTERALPALTARRALVPARAGQAALPASLATRVPSAPLPQGEILPDLVRAVRQGRSSVKPPAPSITEPASAPIRPLERGAPLPDGGKPALASDLTAARALRRNITSGGQTVAEYRAALDADPHALPLHVNPSLTKLGGVVAQGNGPGARHIASAIDAHRLTVPEQMSEAVATAHGARGEDIVASMARQQKERSAAFSDGLKQIGNDTVTLGPDITEPLAADIHKAPLETAAQIALGHTDPGERAFGKALAGVIDKLHGDTPPGTITLRVSDAQALKRGLAAAADAGFSSIADGASKLKAPTFKNMASAVRDSVASQHPRYADLLKKYGDDSSALDAQKIGYKGLFGNTMADSPAGQAAALGALHGGSDVIQAGHAKGTIEALVMAANRTGDVSAIRSVLKGRDGRAQLTMAIGKDKADALISSLDTLKKHHDANNSIVGNSATFGRAATAEAEREAEATALGRLADAAAAIPHTPAGAAVFAGKAGLKALAKVDRSIIGNPAANEAIGKALGNRAEAERLLALLESKKR